MCAHMASFPNFWVVRFSDLKSYIWSWLSVKKNFGGSSKSKAPQTFWGKILLFGKVYWFRTTLRLFLQICIREKNLFNGWSRVVWPWNLNFVNFYLVNWTLVRNILRYGPFWQNFLKTFPSYGSRYIIRNKIFRKSKCQNPKQVSLNTWRILMN